MHRERVGERRRIRIFEAATLNNYAETSDGIGPDRIPIGISVFTGSCSDVPQDFNSRWTSNGTSTSASTLDGATRPTGNSFDAKMD